jgi:hypothetical protein
MNNKFIALLLMFPILSISFFIGNVHAEAPIDYLPEEKAEIALNKVEKDSWTVDEVKVLVDKYADKYKVSRSMLHKVVNCESHYNYNAVNWQDSHKLSKGSHGVGQFSRETFKGFAKQMGESYTDPYNAENALDVMSWAISKGYGNHWTCHRNLINN